MNAPLKRADPNTIQNKVLVGYQAWFTCAGDGPPIDPGHHGWLHWFNSPLPSGGRPNIDLWPDLSEYDPSELYVAPGLATPAGDPVHLFSSRHPKTVRRHFHWMAVHGVDGAFLQRFAGQCEIKSGNHGIRDLRDEIGDRVREAAEAEGRVFALMYDVSGVSPDKIQCILEQDWMHLIRDKNILDSPNYLREQNRPVVALWGFGFNGRNHTPELVRAIAAFFRSSTPGGVYLVAGTPGHWRTSSSDADRNTEFVQVWTEYFDAISPWTVGRYGNEEEADRWGQGRLKDDAEYLDKLASDGGRKVDYIPVVLPGGSGFNLSEGKWRMNDMRRNGGGFLWRQLYNAQRAGVRTIYGAMWDEYDEGTVFMPVVPHASQLPVHPSFRFLALDVDGHDLPSDWYMRIVGIAAEAFHGKRTLEDALPLGELQDYWRTRPHYETVASVETVETRASADTGDDKRGSVDRLAEGVKKWELTDAGVDIPTDAPPPYSVEEAWKPPSTSIDAGAPPPPVRRDTRPSSSSLVVGGAAAAAAAAAASAATAAVARAVSAGSTSSPPRVNMSSRPVAAPTNTRVGMSTRASYSASGVPPSLIPGSPPRSPPLVDAGLGRQGSHTHGRVDSLAHGGGRVVYSPPAGPPLPLVGGEYPRRGRSRSKDRRSRSRSSERFARQASQMHAPGLGYSQSEGGYGYGPGVHPHPHAHGHSLSPVGSTHGMMPYPGSGAGGYMPVHSQPVGYGYGQGPQGYGQGPAQPGYAPGYPGAGPYASPPGGYAQPPPQGGYYAPAPSGGGGGGLVGSALQAVEGIAGPQRRQQLEKTVGGLLNKLR